MMAGQQPGCPSWCVTDHDREPVAHRGTRTTVNLRGADAIDVRAWSVFGPEVVFITNRLGRFVSLAVVPGPGLGGEPVGEGLAALVEALADATPEAHRQIAAAIRAAADAITGGSQS